MHESEENQLHALGAAMKQADAAMEARLGRLVRGELSAEEQSSLVGEAEHDAELEAAVSMLTPLPTDFHRRVATAAIESSRSQTLIRRWRGMGMLAAALSAVVLFAVFTPGLNGFGPLPDYRLEIEAADAWRDDDRHIKLPSDTEVIIAMTPDTTLRGAMVAQLFITSADGALLVPAIAPHSVRDGKAIWRGTMASLVPKATGVVRLRAVMHRPNAPTPGLDQPGDDVYRVRTLTVAIEPPTP